MDYHLTEIIWDTDGEDAEALNLPTELTIDGSGENFEDVSQINDWLSDKYGWTVEAFACEEVVAPSMK